MTDRVPGAPGQYSAVIRTEELEKLQNGENFIITLTRDDQPITPGTPYSKAAVLPDELAALICPGVEDPAPKDALEGLYTGKAPAGFGYGDPLTFYINEDNTFEAVLKQIYATMEDGSAKQIQFYDKLGLYDNKFIGTLWRYTGEHGVLDAVSYSGLSARKRFHHSQWHPWEWRNPPMIAGVEYRTTERYNGEVVYCKHISHTSTESYGGYGETPVSVSIPHGISGYDSIVRVDARHKGGHLLPIITSGGGTAAVVGVTTSNIELRFLDCSFEARTWKFNLYYTKG